MREKYCSLRDKFDKSLRKAKRAFQLQEQMKLQDQLHNVETPRDFWTKIGQIGIANERKTSVPLEVLIDDGQVSTDHEVIM